MTPSTIAERRTEINERRTCPMAQEIEINQIPKSKKSLHDTWPIAGPKNSPIRTTAERRFAVFMHWDRHLCFCRPVHHMKWASATKFADALNPKAETGDASVRERLDA